MRNLKFLALSPLLLAQAMRTRARVPRLPEPPGPRSGSSGQGQPLRLLIAGDSAAAGVGAAHQDQALSGQLVQGLASAFHVHWRLEAQTGATTRSTLARLRQLESGPFDVVVTSLGVNDVTGLVPLRRWLAQQRQLRDLLRQRLGARLIVASGLPPMHGFPALPRPLRDYLGDRATRFDQALAIDLARAPGCAFLSVRFTEDPGQMASDGFHPGPMVYAEWARRLAALIIARLPSASSRRP